MHFSVFCGIHIYFLSILSSKSWQNVHDNTSFRPRPWPHDFKTTPTTKGWRFALMPPWASRHIGGSRSIHTVHRCPQGKAVGSPKSTTIDRDSTTRLKHLHGSGAGSLKPQIYDATTELDDKIRLSVLEKDSSVDPISLAKCTGDLST